MSEDILQPVVLIVPKMSTAVRDTQVAEVGSVIYNTTTDKLSFCVSALAGTDTWEDVTSS